VEACTNITASFSVTASFLI